MATRSAKGVDKTIPVSDYEHAEARRTNNPPSGLAHLDRDETPVRTLEYDPHLDPQMLWSGKSERSSVDVPAPSIHVHEELSAEKIVGSVRRQRTQQALFEMEALDPAKAVEFYQHDLAWSNRMILGDSLVAMASLLDRERLAGGVQCVYMDPPYGIKYGSNFQPSISERGVKDGEDKSLTREPEMIQAYRDTWELGIHSYLSYLRDRLQLSKELLAASGSIFVQIGDENVHRVAVLLDEVFGAENRVATLTVVKTSGSTSSTVPRIADYILWYAKDSEQLKIRPLFTERTDPGDTYRYVELPDGSRRQMTPSERKDPTTLPDEGRRYTLGDLTSGEFRPTTTVDYEFKGVIYHPGANRHWTVPPESLDVLAAMNRLDVAGNTLRYVRFNDDFPLNRIPDVWVDTGRAGFGEKKRYVVETTPKIVARCILMATDPGDLVLDPTCGSGTTAYVAEQTGRRWITTDTSRVALSLARERILTAKFDYYELVDPQRGVDAGLVYEAIPQVTMRSLAYGEEPVRVPLYDQPKVDRKKVRVSGPFTMEALSRYAVNPQDEAASTPDPAAETGSHVAVLLEALRVQGIPRPGGKPYVIEALAPVAAAGSIQAEGVADLGGRRAKFAVSLGPKFGAVTMGQVSDALREAIGFDLVVFGGFAVSAEAQERLGTGRVGSTDVALLLANPDLLVGDLLKNTKASQTFRLYASPDVRIDAAKDGFRAIVEGVDSFDAATGDVTSFGRAGVQAWFLDDDYDGTVFRASQAFFPVSDAWARLQKALRGTVDAELIESLHGWESLPFESGDHGRVAVRVIAQDGNAAEVVLPLPGA